MDNTEENKPDATLDLSGVKCPINFVKTKLKLEDMEIGQLLEVILDDGEPIRSVPKSLKDEGHKIIKVDEIDGKYRIIVRKNE